MEFLLGAFVCVIAGVFVVALCTISKRSDNDEDNQGK